MARLNHDVLATEVRYALADLTTMSMGELDTLAQLLAQKLAVRGVLAIEERRRTPNGAAVKAALREFAAE
jgi:hypothetical protein